MYISSSQRPRPMYCNYLNNNRNGTCISRHSTPWLDVRMHWRYFEAHCNIRYAPSPCRGNKCLCIRRQIYTAHRGEGTILSWTRRRYSSQSWAGVLSWAPVHISRSSRCPNRNANPLYTPGKSSDGLHNHSLSLSHQTPILSWCCTSPLICRVQSAADGHNSFGSRCPSNTAHRVASPGRTYSPSRHNSGVSRKSA